MKVWEYTICFDNFRNLEFEVASWATNFWY